MSRVILVCGRALNSAQVQRFTGRGPTLSVNDQSPNETRGVGPAVRTGNPSVSDWPGGTRSANSGAGRRPVKPLVAMTLLLEVNQLRLLASGGIFAPGASGGLDE